MWNGMYVYLTVSVIFIVMAGYFLYQVNDIYKDIRVIKNNTAVQSKKSCGGNCQCKCGGAR